MILNCVVLTRPSFKNLMSHSALLLQGRFSESRQKIMMTDMVSHDSKFFLRYDTTTIKSKFKSFFGVDKKPKRAAFVYDPLPRLRNPDFDVELDESVFDTTVLP